jgi:hypothetical protein
LSAQDRNAVSQAASQIDHRLETNPGNEGESRGIDLRITFLSPLGALFHVDPARRQVQVIHVWRYHSS